MAAKEPKGTRNSDGRSSIYKGSDGYWHGRVTVGIKDNGKPDRRHCMSRDRAKVVEKVTALEKRRDSGRVPKAGSKKWTVETWLNHWLTIAKPNLTDDAYSAYEVAVRVHLIPGLGAHRLEKLEPEHLERLYTKLQEAGAKPATAHQVHRTIRTSLGVAQDRGHITDNPAAKALPPRLDLEEEDEIEPYTAEEVQAILDEAKTRRNGARWAVALALGVRQGEALGLRWSDIDLDNGSLWTRRGRARPRYKHGCDEQPCNKKAGYCPRRIQTNADTKPTKSRAGKRQIGLPAELVELLRQHKQKQEREKTAARQLWQEGDWVFTTRTGRPLNPNTDYREWKDILKKAGVRDARLHDARHTAATVLLLLGVSERVVMELMGWSSRSMLKRYQHVLAKIRTDIAQRVGAYIWKTEQPATQPAMPDRPQPTQPQPTRARSERIAGRRRARN